MALRLLVFDRTCVRGVGGLSPVWSLGSRLYRGLGRIDGVRGVASWSEAFAFISEQREPIEELQFWGHGRWGRAFVAEEPLDAGALSPNHRLHDGLASLKERLAPNGLVWFRTCETLGAARGIDFGERLADHLGARVAGHTFIIGLHQSGLHGLAPGVRADWSPDEGLAEGSAAEPKRARWSTPFAPRTITCFAGQVPPAWFARADLVAGAVERKS